MSSYCWLPLPSQRPHARVCGPTIALWQKLHEAHGILRVQIGECLALDASIRKERGWPRMAEAVAS